MISIKENKTHIMQMKDDYKITEVKKSSIVDFFVDMKNDELSIVFKTNKDDLIMHFISKEQFNIAISSLIAITDKMGF